MDSMCLFAIDMFSLQDFGGFDFSLCSMKMVRLFSLLNVVRRFSCRFYGSCVGVAALADWATGIIERGCPQVALTFPPSQTLYYQLVRI